MQHRLLLCHNSRVPPGTNHNIATLVVLLVGSSNNFQPQIPTCDIIRMVALGTPLGKNAELFTNLCLKTSLFPMNFYSFFSRIWYLTVWLFDIDCCSIESNFYQPLLNIFTQTHCTEDHPWILVICWYIYQLNRFKLSGLKIYPLDKSADCLAAQCMSAAGG